MSPAELESLEREIAGLRGKVDRLRAEVGKAFLGHEDLVEQATLALLAGGHCLIEGVPGLGKTLLVRTLARALDLQYARIQFTPDLMPADITGTNLLVEDERGHRGFRFEAGPIFANVVLADEINRATPKTQAALLEAMQEAAVTVAGTRHPLEEPFLVFATQNPIEMEGTYPLPEAQLDRFLLKLKVTSPSVDHLVRILEATTGASTAEVAPVLARPDVLRLRQLVREVPVAEHLKRFAALAVALSSPSSPEAPEPVRKYLRFGSSPRGAQAMVLCGKARGLLGGRYHVSLEDLKSLSFPALRHRLILNFEAEAEGIDPDRIVEAVIGEASRRV
ncbi:MAG TPA: AAA family ATPase [Planctomycetota bacterium]|nr:AAA family ATPase [Planctomycetota bacterium]